jgi:Xaa-Pro dipeptidase
MDHNAKPRLHPISPDVLREGMVFNVEPGVYIDGECGLRHCEVVVCKANAPVVLTDFP